MPGDITVLKRETVLGILGFFSDFFGKQMMKLGILLLYACIYIRL